MNRSANLIKRMLKEKIDLAIKYTDLCFWGLNDKALEQFVIENSKKLSTASESELSNIYLDFMAEHIDEIDADCLGLVLINNYIEKVTLDPEMDEKTKKEKCNKALKILKESMKNNKFKLSYVQFDPKTELYKMDYISYDKLVRTVNGKERKDSLLDKIEEIIPLERLIKNTTIYNYDVFIKRGNDIDSKMSSDIIKTLLYNTIKSEEFEEKEEIFKDFSKGRIDKILKIKSYV